MTRKVKGNRPRAVSEVKSERSGLKNVVQAKKKGGGGNYTWGLPGDEYRAPVLTALDEKDPNYDSEADEGFILKNHSGPKVSGHQTRKFCPRKASFLTYDKMFNFEPTQITMAEFKARLTELIPRFFVERDLDGLVNDISDQKSLLLNHEVVKKLITISCGLTDSDRDLASTAITRLTDAKVVIRSQVASAFANLLENIDDLEIDYPNARICLSIFIAKAVSDDNLPPKFLIEWDHEGTDDIIEHAKNLLTTEHGMSFLETFGKPRATDELKAEIRLSLEEFFTVGDVNECVQSLRSLEAPLFMHEVVKRGIILSLSRGSKEMALTSGLINQMSRLDMLSTQQTLLGFQRVFQELDDIELDNPGCKRTVETFALKAVEDGLLSADDLDEVREKAERVSRERKRDTDAIIARSRVQSA